MLFGICLNSGDLLSLQKIIVYHIMGKRLTRKQEKFCNYYVECGNASEAYRLAYVCSDSKDKSVWEMASNLLKNAKVSSRVAELREEQKKKSDIRKEDVLKVLRAIMNADIRDFLTLKDGVLTFKDSSEWTDEMAMQVESVKQTRDGIELKLNGKAWSIQRICKMLGFDTPQELNVNMAKPMTMDEAKRILAEL